MKLAVEFFDAVIADTCRILRDHLVQLVRPPATKAAAFPSKYLVQILSGLFRSDVRIDPTGRNPRIGDLRIFLRICD